MTAPALPVGLTGFLVRHWRALERLANGGHNPLRSSTLTAAAYLTDQRELYRADATGGAFTLTLPAAADAQGRLLRVIRLNAGANAVTIAAAGADTINGAATIALGAQYVTATLISNGVDGWDRF